MRFFLLVGLMLIATDSFSQSCDPFSNPGMSEGCCGPGISDTPRRIRLNNVSVQNIDVKEDATIYYKLIVDAEGNVVGFSHLKSKRQQLT